MRWFSLLRIIQSLPILFFGLISKALRFSRLFWNPEKILAQHFHLPPGTLTEFYVSGINPLNTPSLPRSNATPHRSLPSRMPGHATFAPCMPIS